MPSVLRGGTQSRRRVGADFKPFSPAFGSQCLWVCVCVCKEVARVRTCTWCGTYPSQAAAGPRRTPSQACSRRAASGPGRRESPATLASLPRPWAFRSQQASRRPIPRSWPPSPSGALPSPSPSALECAKEGNEVHVRREPRPRHLAEPAFVESEALPICRHRADRRWRACRGGAPPLADTTTLLGILRVRYGRTLPPSNSASSATPREPECCR